MKDHPSTKIQFRNVICPMDIGFDDFRCLETGTYSTVSRNYMTQKIGWLVAYPLHMVLIAKDSTMERGF